MGSPANSRAASPARRQLSSSVIGEMTPNMAAREEYKRRKANTTTQAAQDESFNMTNPTNSGGAVHLADGSASFNEQFRTLFLKQWLLLKHRKVSTIVILAISAAVQIFAAWGLLQDISNGLQPNDLPLAAPWAMMCIIFFGMFVLRTAGDLCTEKRDRIREGMRMMGMNDAPYYCSLLAFETMQAAWSAVLGAVGGLVMGLLESPSYCDPEDKSTTYVCKNYNVGVFTLEWTLFVFMLHMLAVTFGMAMSTFFVSNHGSKVVFVLWSLSVLPPIGELVKPLNWKAGWRFLPGEYVEEMLRHATTYPDGLGKFLLEILYAALYVAFMFLLYCYLDQVIAHKEGRSRHWLFIFKGEFWRSVFSKDKVPPSLQEIEQQKDEERLNPDVEFEQDPRLIAKASNFQCVKTGNLDVVFKGAQGEEIHAVDKLNLTMYEDQIFVLLGHNGAGKTTTMHCLSGLIKPTSGALNAYGLSIPKDIDSVRKSFGFCPQHNQLWKNLTVKEHLKLFARFRNKKLTDAELESFIEEIGLNGSANQAAGALSGGQKRKLSVGIAFIGDPKFVILDEPSSGMDTFARRQLWEFLKSRREGRVIMITTHFMDEADALADRAAVMAHGKLQAMGSPAFLKKRFGCGYMLTAAPTNSTHTAALFSKLKDVCALRLNCQEDVTFLTQGKEVVVRMPFARRDELPQVLDDLAFVKRHEPELCDSYGVSVANLEEVFLKIADGEKNKDAIDSDVSNLLVSKTRSLSATAMPDFDPDRAATFGEQFRSMFYRRWRIAMRSKVATILSLIVPLLLLIATAVGHRLIYGDPNGTDLDKNDTSGAIFGALALGALLMAMSLAFLTVAATDFAVMENSSGVKDFLFINGCGYYVYWASNTLWDFLSAIPWLIVCIIIWAIPWFTFHDILVTELGAFVVMFVMFALCSAFFAYVLSQMLSTPWKSVIICLLFNGLVVAICAIQYTSKINNDISESNDREPDTGGAIAVVGSIMDIIGFFFPTYSLVTFSCRSSLRAQAWAKVSQVYATNLLTQPYTCSNTTFTSAQVPTTEPGPNDVVPEIIFDGHVFQTSGFTICANEAQLTYSQFKGVTLSSNAFQSLIEPAWPSMLSAPDPLTVSKEVGKTAAAGLVADPNILSTQFYEIQNWKDDTIWSTFNPDQQNALARCFAKMIDNAVSTQQSYKAQSDGYVGACNHDWSSCKQDVEGGAYDFLNSKIAGGGMGAVVDTTEGLRDLIRGAALLILTFLLAFSWEWIKNSKWMQNRKLPRDKPERIGEKDALVLAEEERVKASNKDEEIIRVEGLRRVFQTKKKKKVHAVRGVSWSANSGGVFGLLGTNGAGKTTTFKMMCGIIPPSEGAVSIRGVDMTTDKHKGRRLIGYCPQFDALWQKLTVFETLYIYASLRGYRGDELTRAVESQISGMQLQEYRDRFAGSLSGGNKRKLSVAIALIGQPPTVFLDEPSTGMDPVARRFMWTVIQELADSRSDCVVVLTTHSMDEASALCERIAIQVDGSFRCLGTAQQIKDIHGSGYEITVRLAPPPAADDVSRDDWVKAHTDDVRERLQDFRMLREVEINSLNATFVVDVDAAGLSDLMRTMHHCAKKNSAIADWYVTQQTLESVFNHFAATSENAGVDNSE